MATNSSDVLSPKQPPLPSPLRFSKFYQVYYHFIIIIIINNLLATLLFSFVIWIAQLKFIVNWLDIVYTMEIFSIFLSCVPDA